jgi:DNA-binding MarR family transcriptional regulator
MLNLEILNKALGQVTPSEFTVLYFIANNLSLKETSRTKIYREQIADKLNIDVRQVSRLTDSLMAKGFIKKDNIAESKVRTVCYYSLPTGMKENKNLQEPHSVVDENVSLKKNIKYKENNKNINKIESKEKNCKNDNSFLDFVSQREREAGMPL